MVHSHRTGALAALSLACAAALLLPVTAAAYTQWSVADDATNCRACHGDFRSNLYISDADGQLWGNLHNIHRTDMLSGDCAACHLASDEFPVPLDSSAGGSGLAAIGCMGCHGRDEDNVVGNPSFPNGRGAGLRQQHTNAGVNDCIPCHADADPANYTPAGENVMPPYYANPGTGHPNMPTGPCNDDGSEDFAGATTGQDNDGDGVYDGDDGNCSLSGIASPSLPTVMLMQNHPNPFNPSTQIQYTVNTPGHVRLRVYSTNGELVRTLVNGHHDEGSTHQASWDGRDDGGRALASAIYFYRLDTPDGTEMKKMTLLK